MSGDDPPAGSSGGIRGMGTEVLLARFRAGSGGDISIYIIIDSLFIFSVSKLLLNDALYDDEIWHADA